MLYTSLIALSLFLQNLYNITHGFKLMPLYDSYSDYAAIRTFMKEGRIYQFQLPRGSPINTLYAGSWPLCSIFTMIFSITTGIDVLPSCLFMPSVYGIVMLLFIVLFSKVLLKVSPHMNNALAITLLIFAVSPDTVYDRMIFYHRFFGEALFFVALYLVAREFCSQRTSVGTHVLFVLLSVAIPLSQSVVSYTWVLFLFYFMVSAKMRGLFFKKERSSMSIVAPRLALSSFALCIVLAWNTYIAPAAIPQLWKYVIGLLSPIPNPVGVELVKPMYIPEALASPLMVYILRARDIALYLPALSGLLIFLIGFILRRDENPRNMFLLYSLVAFAAMFAANFMAKSNPLNLATSYAMPLILYFTSSCYAFMLQNGHMNERKVVKILASLSLIFIVFTAFLSPWSHRYFANFLYDPSIKSEKVGVHNPMHFNLIPFVEKHLSIQNKIILSDDTHLMYMILQPKDYGAVSTYLLDLLGKDNTYIFEFINFNPQLALVHYDIPKNMVEMEYNKVLDAQHYAIWYKGA